MLQGSKELTFLHTEAFPGAAASRRVLQTRTVSDKPMGQGFITSRTPVRNKSLRGAGGWFTAGCSVGAAVPLSRRSGLAAHLIPTALRSHQEPAISPTIPAVVFGLRREL